MAHRAMITLAAPVFERYYLLVFALLDDFGRDLAAISYLSAIDVHQHLKRGRFARLYVQKIDIYGLAFRDAILPATGLDDCVCHKISASREKKPRKVSQKERVDKRKGLSPSPSAMNATQRVAPTNNTISPFGGRAS